MSTPPSITNASQEPPPPKSKWRPIVLTIVSAVLLGAGSCFGAISSSGGNLTFVLSAVFVACVGAFVGGLFWALGTWIEGIRRRG
jgi:hypothetical protein